MEKAVVADSISETLFINIPIKAGEGSRANGILHDPFSEELMDRLDYDFARFSIGGIAAAGVVIRTQYFDEETLAFFNRNQGKELVVVHVGAGLDTRYLRIGGPALPAAFYELDLPDVMDLRERMLPPMENERIVRASMFDTEWMDALATEHPNAYFLFVMEGVAFYFSEEKIRKFFCNLADRFRGEVFCDLISTWTIRRFYKKKAMEDMGAGFTFGIDDVREIENWHPRIRHAKSVRLAKRHPKRWGFLAGRVLSRVPSIKNSSMLTTYELG